MITRLINKHKLSWLEGKRDASKREMTLLSIAYCMPHELMLHSDRYTRAHARHAEAIEAIEAMKTA
jgi:hypothetical protein